MIYRAVWTLNDNAVLIISVADGRGLGLGLNVRVLYRCYFSMITPNTKDFEPRLVRVPDPTPETAH